MSIETTAQTWLKAHDIITEALGEIGGKGGVTDRERNNASAIIARLAKAGLVIYSMEEIEQERQTHFNPYPG